MSERTPLLHPPDEESVVHPRAISPPRPKSRLNPRSPLVQFSVAGLILTLIILVVVTVIVFGRGTDPHPIDHDAFLNALKPEHIFNHLSILESIARQSENNGSRGIMFGYNASAEYVYALLETRANCDVWRQYFRVPVWEETGKHKLAVDFEGTRVTYQLDVDFGAMRYGGQSGIVEGARIVPVPGNGCKDENYADLDVQGKVVLIQEGGKCELWDAAWRAEGRNASAVIIYGTPQRKSLLLRTKIRIVDWEEGDPLMTIPVVTVLSSIGQTLAASADHAKVFLETNTRITIETTFNVLCESRRGNEQSKIILGAHLDSVPTGPGMVDNGSGSSSLLEIALFISHTKLHTFNQITFAWWGAEEIGQLGSRHYVRCLTAKQKEDVALMLNFDMLGSPNWVPFIHKGSDAPPKIRSASIQIQHAFELYFKLKRIDYELTSMVIGSDFLPFLEHGIPAGGLLTGAGELKTEEQQCRFGGFANAPLDPCYHQSCDTMENVNQDAIDTMAHAALYVISRFARHRGLREYLAGEVPLE